MRIHLSDGTEYKLHFWHHERLDHRKRPFKKPRYMTELFLHTGDCQINRETGHCATEGHHADTRCHTKLDVFRRENGRATVLDRLLKSASVAGRELFPRERRIQIWQAYKAAGAKLPRSRASR